MGMRGPCGDPTAIVQRGGVITEAGETSGGGRGVGEMGSGRVWLRGVAGAEVLAHLRKCQSALGDVGRTETTAGVALYESLGEEKVCDALSPDLDVLLGLRGRTYIRMSGEQWAVLRLTLSHSGRRSTKPRQWMRSLLQVLQVPSSLRTSSHF